MKTYLERQAENQKLVEDYIDSLECLNNNAWCFLGLIDEDTTSDDIEEMLYNHNAFDEEVIYYDRAIKYIAKEDPSLVECMELASEYGYELRNISSEVLASLLQTQRNMEKWNDSLHDVQEFLDSLDWSYEQD